MTIPNKQKVFLALVGSGFTPKNISATPNYHLFNVTRTELFGSKINYSIVVASKILSHTDLEWLMKDAKRTGSTLILVGDAQKQPIDVPVLSYNQFFDRLGGPIFSLLPFDEEYKNRLITLGHNRLPTELSGKADELFEHYVHAGLQFLFRSRVIKNGNNRRGEAVPDGIAIGSSIPLMMYDAKAAADGYKMSMQAVRQFSDYVEEFHKTYKGLAGALNYFLVISGHFSDDEESLEERSRDVQAKCQVPVSFLTTDTMASIVDLLVHEPAYRPTINWSRVFARPVVKLSDVEKQLKARIKDEIVPSKSKD